MSDPRTPNSDRLIDEQYAATGTIYGTSDPAEMLGAILSFAAVPFTYADLSLLRDATAALTDSTVVDVVAEAVSGQAARSARGLRRLADYPAYDTLAAVELLHVESVSADAFLNDDERERLKARGVASLIVLPLVARQLLIGLITIEQIAHSPIEADRLRALRRLADQAAVVLQNQSLLNAARTNAETLSTRVAALETLNRLSIELGRFVDEQELLDYATRTIAQSLRVDHAGLVTLDPDRQAGSVTSEWPLSGTIGTRMDFRSNELFDLMMNNLPEPFVLNRALESPLVTDETKTIFRGLGIQSLILLPIMIRDEIYASLGLDFFDPQRAISDDDVSLARTIVGQVSVALQNVRLLRDTRRRADQLQRIANFGRSVSATLELPNIYRIMLTEAAQMLTVDRMQIAMFDPIDGGLRFVGRFEDDKPTVRIDAPVDLAAGSSTAGEVWKQQRFIYHPDTLELRGTRSSHDIGLRSIMGAPIRLRGRTVGSIVIGCFRPHTYGETDGVLFQQIVNQFAIALENAEAYAQSQRIAKTEALVSEIGVQFQRAGDLRRMSEIALRELSTALGATQARIRLNPLEVAGDTVERSAARPARERDGAAANGTSQDTW